MAIVHISIPKQALQDFCERHHIQKLALFGSVLRDDFSADSDIDILVEFHPDYIPGWEIVSMQYELSTLLGRNVDLRTVDELSDTFRMDVVRQSVIIYE